ncbi:hypothetical protein ACFVTF_28680 [Kitasatospora sp. NPDC057940]|uniref:ATP-dependent DNA ligase n=1 Tax=Kitasatospora sp. NPDC057940 TaxID=3346285 RepID=UPI0036D7E06D
MRIAQHTPSARAAERPMLAVLSDRRSFGGVRVRALRDGDRVQLLSRGGKLCERSYPELVHALAGQSCREFTVDGEIVAVHDGRTDFSLLQQRSGITDPRAALAASIPVFYYLFDLLRLDGHDLTLLPLRTRKALLRGALAFDDPLRFTPHRNHWTRGSSTLPAPAAGRA